MEPEKGSLVSCWLRGECKHAIRLYCDYELIWEFPTNQEPHYRAQIGGLFLQGHPFIRTPLFMETAIYRDYGDHALSEILGGIC